MKANPLPEDADQLVAFAEAIATLLSEKHDQLGIGTDVEALLRASVAATTFAIDGYLAFLAGARKSPVARKHLGEAKARCHRSIERLRRRVSRSITHLCRLMDEKDLLQLANCLL